MALVLKPTVTLYPTDSHVLAAEAKDPEGAAISGQSVNWTSSDIAIATVSPASGTSTTVTAVGIGTVTVTATIPAAPPAIPAQVQAICEVRVVNHVTSLAIIPQ